MDKINLKEKRIVLISPDMYDYPVEILKTLEFYGAIVMYFRDRPQNTATRFLRHTNKQIHDKIKASYIENIHLNLRNKLLDYVLIIKGTAITSEFLKQLRLDHPETKIIMYQWDANKIHPYLHLVEYVDRCFVFDAAETFLHPKLKYLPLFFIDSYKSLRNSNKTMDIDLLHIGTLHEGRYNQIREIESQLASSKLNIYLYLFLPFTGWIKRILKGKFYLSIKFVSLNKLDILKLYQRSKAVLDIPQVGQTGLTLRTFEVLGAHKKLITTNVSILNEGIYTPELVYVLDNDKRDLNDFLKSEVVITEEMNNKIEAYSIHHWVKQIFA